MSSQTPPRDDDEEGYAVIDLINADVRPDGGVLNFGVGGTSLDAIEVAREYLNGAVATLAAENGLQIIGSQISQYEPSPTRTYRGIGKGRWGDELQGRTKVTYPRGGNYKQ